MEKIPSAFEAYSEEEINAVDRQEIQESIFLTLVKERLLGDFEETLEEVIDSGEEIEEWKAALRSLPPHLLSSFLAVPFELRKNRLLALRKKREGAHSLDEVIHEAALASYDTGYRIGYHASPNKIEPSKDPKTKRATWTVDGLEHDHRDNDLSRAYYSLDLAHLYRKKNPKHLYIIRADTSSKSRHERDNDGSWGRAGKLDIVSSIDYQEAMQEVERRYKEFLASTQKNSAEEK